MHSLPSWLCVLPALETLLVDGNPFQGPWKALMEPLLSRNGPLSPSFQPSTPMFPLHSASIQSTFTTTTDADDTEESVTSGDPHSRDDEDITVTSPRAPNLSRSITAPTTHSGSQLPSPSLSRTRTTPNRAYFEKSRTSSNTPQSMFSEAGPSKSPRATPDLDREVRKMKSAGELRRTYGNSLRNPSTSASSSPQRPALTEYVTSASSSNLLSMGSSAQADQSVPRRFASLGVASGAMSPTTSSRSRRTVDSSIWDDPTEEEPNEPVPPLPNNRIVFPQEGAYAMDHALPPRPRPKDDKSSRWGFLKKMSMGKMRPDQAPMSRNTVHGSQIRNQHYPTPRGPMHKSAAIPSIDVRISTTGTLLHQQQQHQQDNSEHAPVPPSLSRKTSSDLLKISPLDQLKKASNEAAKLAPITSPTNGLLAPALGPTSRATKRRSFLPIDVSPIPIPNASQFVPGVTATNSEEAEELAQSAPSPVQVESYDEIQRREEERAREARIRALRSVMSYLRDMYDLSLSQSQTMSLYGGLPETPPTRSRRPTMVDSGRLPSEASLASAASGGSSSSRPESVNLRTTEGRINITRNGSTTQTNSVATTDSAGSGGGEERKYKDDKAKRARVIREIVECVLLICSPVAHHLAFCLTEPNGRMSRGCRSLWTSTSGLLVPP